jgi:hypothetical protein
MLTSKQIVKIFPIFTPNFQVFLHLLLIYSFISYLICPFIFYYLSDRSIKSAGRGMVVGSIVSILLWYSVGEKLTEIKIQ